MKLLLINGNTDPAITALILGRAQAALPRLGLGHLRLEAVTARFGARYIATRAAVAIAGHAVLDALATNLRPDHAGAIIACFGEPGLEAAREILPIPVQGMAEASLAIGHRIAPRIAFLTGGAGWVPMLEEFCLARGLGADRVLVHAVAPTGDMIAANPEAALALLAEATRAAAAEGCGAVVLGGAGLAGLAQRLSDAVPVPVLDSLDCALLRAAEAGAQATAGVAQAPQAGLSPALAALLGAH
ncbi:aspartate/glutamate racemase family protein [Plastoroseomonas arctica]|uniref:Asp/Glu racemase n=1 Tax=Plastoroseomonas arctica TaxID=1509237 RepID=A0AAF1JVJ5_9PROT|nr:aspartate/glutamate racemase family protein [Plastoroseomonas arctica]MBR0654077.1 Asp/Glu racemase [Plastoroseomonas arctica]